ncbi:MAG TPA: DUF1896 family protein [Chitinophagaceae bacterium]|nr:DUF1896 family protein [Chitinophagaceae bacterium]
MQELLHIKLRNYLAVHYPGMLLSLAEEGKEEAFIREQVESISGEMDAMLAGGAPAYEVEVACMDILIASLPPSKYDYVLDILEEDFPEKLSAFESSGITLYEICNIIAACGELLEGFDEEDEAIHEAVLTVVANYFAHPETVGHGV